MALTLFLLGVVGLAVSLYPYIVPQSVTIWAAAAPPRSQPFMLAGPLVIVPMVIAYTGCC